MFYCCHVLAMNGQVRLKRLQFSIILINSLSLRTWISKSTHWGRVRYICFSKLTIIGSDNGLSPGRRQAIIWTSDEILSQWNLQRNYAFSFKKMHELNEISKSVRSWFLYNREGIGLFHHSQDIVVDKTIPRAALIWNHGNGPISYRKSLITRIYKFTYRVNVHCYTVPALLSLTDGRKFVD